MYPASARDALSGPALRRLDSAQQDCALKVLHRPVATGSDRRRYRGDCDRALAYFDPEVEVDASMRVDEEVGHSRYSVYAMVAPG
jgi:hypothetical protein